jgi:hypothetical protein
MSIGRRHVPATTVLLAVALASSCTGAGDAPGAASPGARSAPTAAFDEHAPASALVAAIATPSSGRLVATELPPIEDGQRCEEYPCHWFQVLISGFPVGSKVSVQEHDTAHDGPDTLEITVTASGTGGQAFLMGGPVGMQAWATIGNERSNFVTWTERGVR